MPGALSGFAGSGVPAPDVCLCAPGVLLGATIASTVWRRSVVAAQPSLRANRPAPAGRTCASGPLRRHHPAGGLRCDRADRRARCHLPAKERRPLRGAGSAHRAALAAEAKKAHHCRAAHSFRNEKQPDESPTTAGVNSHAFTAGMPLPRSQAPRLVDLPQGPPGAAAGTWPPRDFWAANEAFLALTRPWYTTACNVKRIRQLEVQEEEIADG